jgi:Domain of unknown function (DUF3291)
MHHLAQINIARFRAPAEDPVNADFIANLDRVNALAEAQPGFVWRLIGEGNNALDVHAFDDPSVVVNMSVWTSMEVLAEFVYRNDEHRAIMRRRREWFDKLDIYMALWWIPAGHTPTPAEGKARLDALARLGPTAEAFLFHRPFPAPSAAAISPILDECA